MPIIGPDVSEHIFGGVRTIASDLAQKSRFPLDWHDRSDLAKVAQFILIQNSLEYVRTEVLDGLISELQKAGSRLLGPSAADMEVPDLMQAIVDKLKDVETDPLKIVAALNAKVFVNASSNSLLEMLLGQTRLNGKLKQPVPLVTEWRDERRDDLHPADFPGEPSVEKPFVYYVFGKAQQTSTWVLTEDDFFDYLIRTTRYQLMPPVVSDALVTGSLLFLGFPLDDWKFRVLFRMILAKGGRQLLQGYNHVAVQLDPGETTIAQRAARQEVSRTLFLELQNRYLLGYRSGLPSRIKSPPRPHRASPAGKKKEDLSDDARPASPTQPVRWAQAFERQQLFGCATGRLPNFATCSASERIVLLYAPSGAGKSSLVQAGLIPKLEDRFDIWGPTRVNQQPPPGVANRYTWGVLAGLDCTSDIAPDYYTERLCKGEARRVPSADHYRSVRGSPSGSIPWLWTASALSFPSLASYSATPISGRSSFCGKTILLPS